MDRRLRPFLRGLPALALLVGVPAFAQSAAISATSPATLNQGNLRQATVSVTLTSATYESSADASHFTLATAVPGLTVHGVAFNGGRTVATLRLHYDGSDFDAAATIAVTVDAAGTNHNAALATGTQAVTPARWVNVSKKTIALTEGGSANTYTVVLESQPTGDVSVVVTSDNAAVTVDTDASPLTRTLTFSTTTWNSPQTVTVTPVDDNADAVDELALVTNVATGGGYASSTTADRTVRVTVADDERTGTDYDADDDQLIEIDSLAKLNAVRWDLDGDGTASSGNATTYAAAFPGAATGMGCPDGGDTNQTPDGCRGYELTANLDFDTDGDGRTWTETGGVVSGDSGDAYYNGGAGWAPIGDGMNHYTAVFRGNGHVVRNLFVKLNRGPGNFYAGLFSVLVGPGRIESLGVVDGYVRDTDDVGLLAGWSSGEVAGCYSTGRVVATDDDFGNAGGLIGAFGTNGGVSGSVAASYSTARVTSPHIGGGLIGRVVVTGAATIDNSWAAGPVSGDLSTSGGGLVGLVATNTAPTTASYYDNVATGRTASARGVGLGTAALQGPTSATGVYAYWDDYDLDGDGRIDADDDAWDFGIWSQYPSLKWGGHDPSRQFAAAPVDYDDDNDDLVDVRSLAQLDAVRHDLDGDGAPTAVGHGAYVAAFPNAATGMGCAAACAGYELRNDLDFDTDGDGGVDADDDYPNWTPIPVYAGPAAPAFQTTFRGNGHVIDKLTVRRPVVEVGMNANARSTAGLFGRVGASGRIESLGVVNASVQANGGNFAGIVAGRLEGRIVACYSTGSVSALEGAGGLVGATRSEGSTPSELAKDRARIVASYSTAEVSTIPKLVGSTIPGNAGGLVGIHNNGVVVASYAAGPVTAQSGPAYAGPPAGHGLSGGVSTPAFWVGVVRNSYWDAEATGQTTTYATSQAGVDGGDVGTGIVTTTGGQTTAALKSPTGYTGVYASWNIDLDGDDAPDDPWDFGASSEYPSLKWGGHDPARQFALLPDEEASAVPTDVRTQTTAQGLLVTWRAAAGATSYLVQWRQSGEAWSSRRQSETTGTRYEIAGLPAGAYEVRVLPVVDGQVGEPSAPARGESGVSNRPPLARGIADMALDVGGTAEVDLDAAFSDPDGDALRYAASADGGAVEASVSGATLRLRGTRPGEAAVAVTATDPDGLSASAAFAARVGALLSLRGNPSAPEGGEAAFRAELSRALGTDVEVRWSLAADGDPATADADEADFAAWSGTATIAAGETRARIVVEVLDDDDVEPARERFAVALEEPENPNVGLSARARRAVGSVQEGVCDRTPEVRAELSRGWRACHWPGPADLARLSRFDLRGAGAESLRSDDLLGLSGLRTLDLGGNALRELPPDLLSHSPRLRTLRLDGNRLESLPAGLFAGVSGLRELRLSGNPGAPFALAPELRRADAEPWAAGPATVGAHLPLGAPFAMRLALTDGGRRSVGRRNWRWRPAPTASDAVRRLRRRPGALVARRADDSRRRAAATAHASTALTAQGATLALFANTAECRRRRGASRPSGCRRRAHRPLRPLRGGRRRRTDLLGDRGRPAPGIRLGERRDPARIGKRRRRGGHGDGDGRGDRRLRADGDPALRGGSLPAPARQLARLAHGADAPRLQSVASAASPFAPGRGAVRSLWLSSEKGARLGLSP